MSTRFKTKLYEALHQLDPVVAQSLANADAASVYATCKDKFAAARVADKPRRDAITASATSVKEAVEKWDLDPLTKAWGECCELARTMSIIEDIAKRDATGTDRYWGRRARESQARDLSKKYYWICLNDEYREHYVHTFVSRPCPYSGDAYRRESMRRLRDFDSGKWEP